MQSQVRSEMEVRESALEDTGGNLRFLHALLAEVQLDRTSRVLEIGCGTGALGEFLAAATGAKVYGTERSAELSLIANRRIPCIYYPDGGLPVLDSPLDLIYCKDVLMMIKNKRQFFREVRCRLVKGGAFCTYLPDEGDIETKQLFNFISAGKAESRRCYGTIEGNIALLGECGFEDVRTKRLLLGNIQINETYVHKHWNGFFSNTDISTYERERKTGLVNLLDCIQNLDTFGILAHYEWERTMVIAR